MLRRSLSSRHIALASLAALMASCVQTQAPTSMTRAPALALPAQQAEHVPDATTPATKVGPGLTDAQAEAAAALAALGADYWNAQLAHDPTWATYLGEHAHGDKLPDVSPVARRARLATLRVFAERLAGIERTALSPDGAVTADVLDAALQNELGEAKCRLAEWALDPLSGPQTWLAELPAYAPLRDEADLGAMRARLEAMPAYFDQTTANLAAGMADGLTAPRPVVKRVVRQLDELLARPLDTLPWVTRADKDEAAHVFAASATRTSPDDGTPGGTKADETARAQSQARVKAVLTAATRTHVVPALTRFRDFLANQVLPRARQSIAVTALQAPGVPDFGRTCYAALVTKHTGLVVRPQSVHQTGLDEVARIEGEMRALARAAGHNSIAALKTALAGAKDAHFDSAAAIVAHNQALLERMQAALPALFGTLPQTRVELREMEAFRAKDAPAAYYYPAAHDGSRPGVYMINTYAPHTRPRGNMAALAFHEAIPGHHLQIALAMENKAIPAFQRELGQTAFVEGWALYAEHLAWEQGLYKTTAEKFGKLKFEMWRAVRLVVDTGMHSADVPGGAWSRDKALAYLLDKADLPRAEAENEIDRYITWPGQALAYKMGMLEMRALRQKAETALGPAFDLRAYHDTVLARGAIPLTALRRVVDAYIADVQAGATP